MNEYCWHDLAPRTAAGQMAIDSAMVHVAREEHLTLFRLYRWRDHTVSMGANESALRHWDRSLLEQDGVRVVRRPTGGRAVWHDQADLTYAWAGAAANPAEVRRIYRDLHERLASAMADSDPTVALAPDRAGPGLGPGACFDVPVGGEVLVQGRKTIGSAQRVYGKHLLQHGAIAIEDRQGRLSRYRMGSAGLDTGASFGVLVDAEPLATTIAAAWRTSGAVPAAPELVSRIVLASMEYLPTYQDPLWTWRR